jgi:hypothetical protein
MTELPIGTRIEHTTLHHTGVVVAAEGICPPEATPVRYDGEDTVWNTPTSKLRVLENEETIPW